MNYKNIETLNEIRRGQIGTGLLIENDGHIITDCEIMINNQIAINKSIEFNRISSYFVITHFKVWRMTHAIMLINGQPLLTMPNKVNISNIIFYSV